MINFHINIKINLNELKIKYRSINTINIKDFLGNILFSIEGDIFSISSRQVFPIL